MAEPKRKVSKQRSNTRYANWKAVEPGLSECPQCHETKMNHRACPKCGYYNNMLVEAPKAKKKD